MKNYIIRWDKTVDSEDITHIECKLISNLAYGTYTVYLHEINEQEKFLLILANSLELVNEDWFILEPKELSDGKYNLYITLEEDEHV